jgi:hypothetical protein
MGHDMQRDVPRFPPWPGRGKGPRLDDNRYWRVTNDCDLLAVYDSTDYPTANQVFEHLIGPEAPADVALSDWVIWRDGTIVAYCHLRGPSDATGGVEVRYMDDPADRIGPAPPTPAHPGYEAWAKDKNIIDVSLGDEPDPEDEEGEEWKRGQGPEDEEPTR